MRWGHMGGDTMGQGHNRRRLGGTMGQKQMGMGLHWTGAQWDGGTWADPNMALPPQNLPYLLLVCITEVAASATMLLLVL